MFHEEKMSYFIDDSLDQVKLSLQRRVQQQSQWVELHSHAVIDAFRARFAQVGSLSLQTQSWSSVTQMLLNGHYNTGKTNVNLRREAAESHPEVRPAEKETSTRCCVQSGLKAEEGLVFQL